MFSRDIHTAKAAEEESAYVYTKPHAYTYGHKDRVYQLYFSKGSTCEREIEDGMSQGKDSG